MNHKQAKKSLESLVREISENHKKILDDWCKAYLAKEYLLGNDIHPGSFAIEQTPIGCQTPLGVGMGGYRYEIVPLKPEKEGWISTEEESPPKDGNIFLSVTRVCIEENKGDYCEIPGVFEDRLTISYFDGKFFRDLFSVYGQIVYWKEIPEMPDTEYKPKKNWYRLNNGE